MINAETDLGPLVSLLLNSLLLNSLQKKINALARSLRGFKEKTYLKTSSVN